VLESPQAFYLRRTTRLQSKVDKKKRKTLQNDEKQSSTKRKNVPGREKEKEGEEVSSNKKSNKRIDLNLTPSENGYSP